MFNIFKKQKPAGTKPEGQKDTTSATKSQAEAKPNPHDNGGCCGSCGGQQEQGS